jgi:TetR/AcrR family transcriptional regulator
MRQRILTAATKEFSAQGFSGARIDRIVAQAKCNIRMIYHHFSSKEGLYVAVLEAVYGEIRTAENTLELKHLPPIEAMRTLVTFTVDHFAAHPDFVRLTGSENLNRGKYVAKSRAIPAMSSPLIETMRDLLRRGEADLLFRHGIDPLQLYVSIVALSCHHLNNAYTLSATFQTDLRSRSWHEIRRQHVTDMVLAYLLSETGSKNADQRMSSVAR